MRLTTIRSSGTTAVHVESPSGHHHVGRPGGGGYRDVRELLEAGDAGLAAARRALDGEAIDVARADIARPVLEPGAIVCVGLNYRSHILEMKRELPTVPTLFSKLARALTDPCAELEVPRYSSQLDYEAELGVVIGAGGRDIAPLDAWDAVAGLTVVNDVTVRDLQWRTKQWFAGKTGEALTPVGPAVVTLDEFESGIGELRLQLRVNGELRQDSTLGDLVLDVPTLIADLSRIVELRPGDIIATGTPGGVGAAMEPKRWLADGDMVEASIDRIGTLANRIVAASGADAASAAVGAGARS